MGISKLAGRSIATGIAELDAGYSYAPRRRTKLHSTVAMLASLSVTAAFVLTATAASAAAPTPPTTAYSTLDGSAATVDLANGTRLVVGGCGPNHCSTVLNTAAIYNPKTKTRTPTGNTVTPHASATATLLPSGQVLLAGGCRGRLCGQDNSTSELWNPTTGLWTATGDMLASPIGGFTPRKASAVLLTSGNVLVAGGINYEAVAQTYNPSTGIWTATTPMRAPRESFTLITLQSGEVLAAGGCDYYYCETIVSSAETFNPSTRAWNATGHMLQARYDHAATLLSSGQVRVTGGITSSGATPAFDEIYTPSTGAWAAA